jgi:F-type H+-transporting ATPase subunit delta
MAQQLESILADLELVESSLHSSLKLRGYLDNPRINFEEKVRTVQDLFKDYIAPAAYDFIFLLLRSSAMSSLTDILRNYKRTREQTGILEFEVKTAAPLAPDEKAVIAEWFAAKLGRRLTIRNVVDPAIIGGIVIKAGDVMIDASVVSKLNNLIKQLRRG